MKKKRNMKTALWICFFIFAGNTMVYAQFNSVGASYSLSPQISLEGDEKYGYSIANISLGNHFLTKINAEKGRFTILTGELNLRYQYINYEYTGTNPTGILLDDVFPRDLFAFIYGVTLIQTISPKFYVMGQASVGLYSDMNNIDINHFLFDGGALLIYKTKYVDLGLGPFFTYAFGKPRIIPAPFLVFTGFQENPKLILTISPPAYGRLGYKFSEDFDAGVTLNTIGNNYEIGDEKFIGDPVFIFSDMILGPDMNLKLSKAFNLSMAGGLTLRRQFSITDKGDDVGSTDIENGAMLKVSLFAKF